MKKKDLVLGNTYVVAALIEGGHSFKVGTEVTYIYDDGSDSPKFKDEVSGNSQYVSVKDLEPELPWVPVVGEKYEVTNDQEDIPKGVWTKFAIGTIVTCISLGGSYAFSKYRFKDETGLQQSLRIGQIKPVTTELEKAEATLKVAEDNLKKLQDKAKADAKAALKFTEDDVKPFMFVEVFGELRLVVTSSKGEITFWEADGTRANHCSRSELLTVLNNTYSKTTKTLKDFCNA